MNRTKMLTVLAGAAMTAGVATAQTTNSAALERELLADAGAHASFQAGGTAGHDGSFFVQDAPGNNRLEIGGYTQFRYTFNNRDTTGLDEDMTNGFDMVRTALEFGGTVANPNLGYYIRGYFDTDGSGGFNLADAYGTYTFDSGLTVIWGQIIVPSTRERMVDDRHQLAADRSAMNLVFTPEYTQGVAFNYEADNFRVIGAIDDGAGNANTAYYSAAEADWGLTGRVEYMWSGQWDQFDDFTSWKGTEGYAGMVGGSFHWETHGDTGNTTTFGGGAPADFDFMQYSADISVEGNGWNAFGSFVGRSFDPKGGSSVDDFGALIQGGVFVSDKVEVFARWDGIFADTNPAGADDLHTLTFGGNYYFFPGSHVAKFTADVQWNLEDQAGASATAFGFGTPDHTTGILPVAADSSDQWMARFQMQLVF